MASTTITKNNDDNNNDRTTSSSETSQAYRSILSKIQSHQHVWFSSPTSPHPLIISQSKKASSAGGLPTISSLSLHPALESALHILNADLPSAHFLLRHAQSDPATEMMFLHGILHRVETDITNTRAWYAKIEDTDVFRHVWGSDRGGDEKWQDFLERLEWWRDSVASRKGSKGKMNVNGGGNGNGDMEYWRKEEEELRELSLWEIMEVVKYCEKKFGVERVDDATGCWVKNDAQTGDKANAMLVGGEGWREF